MKKLKFLPAILMLVLCTGILAVGVLALGPTENYVDGQITVGVSNPAVDISVYHVPTGTTVENAISNLSNRVDGPKTARYGVKLVLDKEKLVINVDGANTPSEVKPMVIAFVLENKSSEKLGAYFLKGELDSTGKATTVNIRETISLAGTPETGSNVADFATATFSEYTAIPAGGSSYVTMSIQLEKFTEVPLTINFENAGVQLNIETYNEKIVETTEVATSSALITEIATAAETDDFVRIKLTEDIDMADLITSASSAPVSPLSAVSTTEVPTLTPEELFNTYGYFIEEFYGEIDGGGHTLTMYTKDIYATAGTYSPAIIGRFSGKLKNITLKFEDLNQSIKWSNGTIVGKSVAFENVTTEGTINLSSSVKNYSPLISNSYSHILFENCTNNLNILGSAERGSAFLGGALYDSNDHVWVNSQGVQRSDGINLEHIKASFINCVNNASLIFNYASMLWGNRARFPQPEDLTVKNCVNNGAITGFTHAGGLFCGFYRGTENSNENYAYVIPYIEAIESDPAKVRNGETGETLKVENVAVSSVANNNEEIKFTNSTGNSYSYEINFDVWSFVTVDNSTIRVQTTIMFDKIAATTNQNVSTGIYDYAFISTEKYKSLTVTNKELVENAEVFTRLDDVTAKLYKVSTSSKTYYYVEYDNADISYVPQIAEGESDVARSLYLRLTVFKTDNSVAKLFNIYRGYYEVD